MVSPFFGSGAFEYYVARNHPEYQVLGFDIFPELVNYHQVFLNDPRSLYDCIKVHYKTPLTKEQFKDAKHLAMRAILYFHAISHSSFSGKLRCHAQQKALKNIESMKDSNYPNIQVKLQSFRETIEQYGNDQDVFLNLDPPYYLKENYYGLESQPLFDYTTLWDLLNTCSCKWMLSYNQHPDILDMYKAYTIQDIPMMSSSNTGKNRIMSELLITLMTKSPILVLLLGCPVK